MATIFKLPPKDKVVDRQFFQVPLSDGLLQGYQWDEQTNTFYAKESQVIVPGQHGMTHIGEDPVPNATPDTPGLMSADDKARLDSLLQTRIGVLGFQGSGFAEDGGFLCFPIGSKVLLPDSSTKAIQDLIIGNEVITHSGKVQKITRVFKRPYDGKLLDFWISGHYHSRLRTTPEHPILAIKNIAKHSAIKMAYTEINVKPDWIQAKELKVGDYVARKFASDVVIDKNCISIQDIAERIEVQEGYAYSYEHTKNNFALGWGKSGSTEKFRNTARPIKNTIDIGSEFLRLCGYYLAEGHVDGPFNRPSEVIFSIHTDEAFGALGSDITHCCEFVFGQKPTIKPNPSGGNGHQLCLQSAIAARFIKKLLPGTAHTKLIPQWMMELPAEKQKSLLLAFFEGDGWINVRKKSKTMGCGLCNEQLINQLCALLERQGATPILRTCRTFLESTQKWYNKFIVSVQASDLPWLWKSLGGPELRQDNPKWPVRLDFSVRSDGYTLRRIKSINTEQYNDFVYNIEVAGDNSYIVNGSIVHNCGDIILAAGTEFISLERIGNVVRFTVDSPIPLDCSCEACSNIYWISDESEVSAIRPPSCNGKMPGVNAYGELKIYTLPETLLVDPKNPLDTLNQKGNYPALIFKRYDNAITPFENEFEMVLKRHSNGTTNTGWAFTPGFNGKADCVWFTGTNENGAQTKFELWPEQIPNLLGQILFNGHLLTKQPAIITDYPGDILSTNNYTLRKWDLQNAKAIGDSFTGKNVWQYDNPEKSPFDNSNPQSLVTDQTRELLPIGTIIDVYQFEINRTSEGRLVRTFFSKRPDVKVNSMWALSGAQRFGDLFTAREEINDPSAETAVSASDINIPDVRLFEKTVWGLNQFEDRLILSDDGGEIEDTDGLVQHEPSGEPINNDIVADIDPTIPGLKIVKQVKSLVGDINGDGIIDDQDLQLFMCSYNKSILDDGYNPNADFNSDGRVDIRDLAILGRQFDLNVEKVPDRPVFLWHRSNHKNALIRSKIGMPDDVSSVTYPPYDILLSAPVDSFDDTYLKILKRGVFTTGVFSGMPFVVAKGMRWEDLPMEGVIRVLTGAFRNSIWRYYFKCAFANWDDDAVILVGRDEVFPFDEDFPIGEGGTGCSAIASAGGTACVTDCPTAAPDETAVTSPTATEVEAPEIPTNTTVVELLRQDFTAPVIRFQFSVDRTTGSESVQLQVLVGMLDMSVPYSLNNGNPEDDLVRGLSPGYTISKVLIQDGFIDDGVGADITSTPSGFRVYRGGELEIPVDGQVEKWNDVEVMFRDNQIYLWWNGLLISPDTVLSASLPTPVTVNTPWFPINPQVNVGKIAVRMFPGAVVRQIEIFDQLVMFNEFTNGAAELTN